MNSVDELDRPASREPDVVQSGKHVLAVHRSRKRIAPFRLHRPVDVDDAIVMLVDHPLACVVAGGSDVINRMKCGEVIEDVVSIGHLSSLRRIDVSRGSLQVGAVCTHHDLAASAVVGCTVPALAHQWGRIANPRVRFKGTVGGNLMARHPDYEGRALLAAVGARLHYATPNGPRVVSCAEQFAAPRDEAGWLLEYVEVPCEADVRLEYDRSLKGIAGLVLGLTLDGSTNHAIGLVTAALLRTALRDERRVLTVSRLQGQDDIAFSLPAVIGRAGAVQVVNPELNDDERRALDASIDVLRTALAALGKI